MPQVFDVAPEEEKKKTKARLPKTETSAAPQQQQAAGQEVHDRGYLQQQNQRDAVLRAAARTTNAVTRETRQYLQGELIKPAVRQDILGSINHRASLLSPKLLANNPQLAAELLLGETKTRDLQDVSHAAYEGWVQQQQDAYREQAEADAIQQYYADPEAWRLSHAIAADPVLLEYAHKARTIKDPTQRVYFAQRLTAAATLPPGAERDEAIRNLQNDYHYAYIGRLTDPASSGLGKVTEVAGQAFNLPFLAVSKAVDLLGAGLEHVPGGNVAAQGLNVVQEAVGDALGAAGTGIQFVQRNLQGAAILLGEGAAHLAQGPNAFLEPLEGGDLTADELWTTWGEVESGEHSPFSVAMARALETDVNDERYQGLFAITDMGVDLIGQVGLFKGLSAARTSLRATIAGGGRFTGETLVNSRLLGGKRVVEVGWKTIENLPSEQRVNALLGKFKKGMTPTLARDLAKATTKDQFSRLLAHGLDDIATLEIPKVQRALDTIRREVKVESESQGGMRPGNESFVHEGNAADLQSYIDGGVRKSTGGSAGGSEGVYVQESARTAQRIVDGLVPEDRILIEVEASPANLTGQAAEGAAVRNIKGAVPPEDIVSIRDYQGNILYERAGATEGSLVRMDALKAEKAALEQRITELRDAEVVFEFPRISHIRPFMRGVGVDSWAGRVLNGLFGESGKLDISKWTNDLTSDDATLIDPANPGKHARWATSNTDVLRKEMNVLRVDKATQARVVDAMFAVERGELSFYDWRQLINEAYRSGKRYTPEIERALRISEASVEARTHSPVERRFGPNPRDTVLENAALDEHGNPLPTRPTQLLSDQTRLPDMRALESGSSALTRFDYWAKNKPVIGKLGHGLRASAAWANLVLLELPRLVLRPGLLVSQLPRLFSKIEFDQSIRAFIAEGVTPADWFNGRIRDFLTRHKTELDPTTGAPLEIGTKERLTPEGTTAPDMTAIGVVASEVLGDVTSVSTKMSTAGIEFRPRDLDLTTKSIHNHIEELAADPIANRVALQGPEATAAWLRSNPDHWAARTMLRDVMPKLEAKGYTLESVLKDLDAEIAQATGGDLALRKAIGTKEWAGYKDTPTAAAAERQVVADEMAQAREQLGFTEDPIMRREINLRLEELERRDAWLSNRPQTQKTISLNDGEAVRAQIADNWRNGAYDMPNEVIVKRPTIKDESVPTTRVERVRAQGQKLNRVLYKGFKPASAATWNMSRGSTFRVVAERIERRLLDRGYSLEAARLHANARAVFITKDLHYDISARSTMDRKLQNYFWFSPVWREQLAVYLQKIPQRAFWAPGIALEWTMASTFIDGLKNAGLVNDRVVFTDPDTGEETRHPFFTLPDGTQIDVGGLNPLTPATEEVGKPPTLAPGAEMILDFTATHVPKELRPFFEGIAEYFSFDGDVEHGVNIIPRTLTVIPEWFGLHIPSETFSNWVDYDNKVDLQVTKLSMSQLAEDGVIPPTPGAYPNENSYNVAMEEYRAHLDAEKRRLEKGIFFTHLVSRVLVPGSIKSEGTDLYAEDSAANDFYEWRAELPADLETEDYYAAVNQYVAKHPEAFPYTVGSHDYAGPRTGDWYDTEAYRNSPMLDDSAYVDKALDQVHYWSEDEPAPELSDTEKAALIANDPKVFNSLSPRRKARQVAEWTLLDPTEMTDVQAKAVGLPAFPGRDAYMREIAAINDQYEAQYDYDKGEDYNALVANHRDYLLEQAAASHGKPGEAYLRYLRATPAVRLNRAGHFTGTQANVVIARAGAVAREAIQDGYSIAGASDTANVLEHKADLFSLVDRLRRESPEFDRQMRYAELGLGRNDTPLGRTAAYQILFFGEPFYDSDLAGDVVEEMNSARYDQ